MKKNELTLFINSYAFLAAAIIVAILIWSLGLPFWPELNLGRAANLTNVTDTLSTSNIGVVSNHTFRFTLADIIDANSSTTIVIDFSGAFKSTSSPAFAATDASDYDIATHAGPQADYTVYASGGCLEDALGGPAAFEISSITSGNAFTYTHCRGTNGLATDTVVSIEIGSNATSSGTGDSQLVNPSDSGSREITISAGGDSAKLRVAIIEDVAVTASVDTSLTFTVSGLATSTDVNGVSTTGETTATEMNFSNLALTTQYTLGQQLAVATNAVNGFVVTVHADQDFQSNSGATIDFFRDGARNTTPAAWAAPSNILDSSNTYGHWGVTSEDSDLNGDEFGASLFAGDFYSTTTRQVFSHTGPAD